MKKHFTKIVAISLLLAILPLTSGFCFQGPLGSMVKSGEVRAASNNVAVVDNSDVCGGGQTNEPVKQQTPLSDHHSVLPCCVDGTHTGGTFISQSIEPVKVIPVIFSTHNLLLPRPVLKFVSYHTPIISPPELISVRTTILRL